MIAELGGAFEYVDCIYKEGEDFPNKYCGYNTKLFNLEAPVRII